MNKEISPANSEQIPDIDSSDWDALINAPNETFNKIAEVEDIDSLKGAELHNKEVDRVEMQLKNALIDSNERFTQSERAACDNLADVLNHSHLESLSRPVQEFGNYSSRLDSERFETLLEYLDQKFSTELNDEDKKRITDELRDTYFKDTTARAGLMAEKTDIIRDKLSQTDNKAFDETIHHFDKYRKDAPNYQVQIAKAYFDYFDEPTDNARNRLNHKVGDYTDLLRSEFGGMADGIVKNKIGSKGLPEAIFFDLARNSAKNFEEMHDALLKYYNHKTSEALNNPPTLESTNTSPDDINLDGQSSNNIPSEIF